MSPGRQTDATDEDATDEHVPVEISLEAEAEGPAVESDTRIDILVDTEAYPTARLDDGRYVAWWFEADAPAPSEPATSEWVAAPTRFLAAGTLHELWENPAALDSLAAQN